MDIDAKTLAALGFRTDEGYAVIPAASFKALPGTFLSPVAVVGIKNAEDMRNISRALLRRFDAASPIVLLAETGESTRCEMGMLSETDAAGERAVVFHPAECIRRAAGEASLDRLIHVMRALRAPDGCPWDKAQDHETLRTYFIQEAYEVVDAIERGDMENLKEELGDVLYQIVFHSRIAEEEGAFTTQDVVDGIADKMVDRHPYVFGTMTAEETAELLGSWEVRKLREKKRRHALSGIPASLPSLLFACIMQKKVSSICMETATSEDVRCHFESSWRKAMELAETGGAKDEIERCLGEALFDAVRLARFCGVDPELALHRFDRLYAEKFGALEEALDRDGKPVTDMTSAMLHTMEEELHMGQVSRTSEQLKEDVV